jgi:hypothetical protein
VIGNGAAAGPRVFLSYAHESTGHRDRVRSFWWALRHHGIDVRCDIDAGQVRREWSRWIEEQLAAADFVLVVASPSYRSRALRESVDPFGRGVEFEASLLRDLMYGDRRKWSGRVLPVVFEGGRRSDVPDFLSPESGTIYFVSDFSRGGLEGLLRVITGQYAERTPPLGIVPVLEVAPPPRPPRAAAGRPALLAALIELLAGLPVMRSAEGREAFAGMVERELRDEFAMATVGVEEEPGDFAADLVLVLHARPGGLLACSKAVHILHRGEEVDLYVHELVKRLDYDLDQM